MERVIDAWANYVKQKKDFTGKELNEPKRACEEVLPQSLAII